MWVLLVLWVCATQLLSFSHACGCAVPRVRAKRGKMTHKTNITHRLTLTLDGTPATGRPDHSMMPRP
jgi:hypothetical protein